MAVAIFEDLQEPAGEFARDTRYSQVIDDKEAGATA